MKFLLKFNALETKNLKQFFLTENAFNVGKDLITGAENSHKFATIDTSSHSISFFNKVSEEKIKAVKIDLSGKKLSKVFFRFLLDFMENIGNFKFTITPNAKNPEINEIKILSMDINGKNPVTIEMDKWNTLNDLIEKEAIFIDLTSSNFLPKVDKSGKNIDFLGKKPAIAFMEMNYAFCDDIRVNSREMFGSVEIYSSALLPDFMFCDFSTLIREFSETGIKNELLSEMLEPKINKKIHELLGEEYDLTVVGLRDENGATAWIPQKVFLEYLDISSEIFTSCFDKLSDKKTESSFEIPSLEDFPKQMVKNVKIYLENKSYLCNFANILEMKRSTICLETGQFEDMIQYAFNS